MSRAFQLNGDKGEVDVNSGPSMDSSSHSMEEGK